MSELTPCNRCTLNRIKRDAEHRDATVLVTRPPVRGDEERSWYEVWVSDQGDKPVAYFLELTEGCAC